MQRKPGWKEREGHCGLQTQTHTKPVAWDYPVFRVSLSQWSPGTRYCGNEQALMTGTGVWACVHPEYSVCACLRGCTHNNCILTVNLPLCMCVCEHVWACVGIGLIFVCALAGGMVGWWWWGSKEAFGKALIAVSLPAPAVTPSSELRLSSLIIHRKHNAN